MPTSGSQPKARGERARRFRPAPAAPPSKAADALDRITIPPGALDRISELISAGASLDHLGPGARPETGRGTDFIVLTR